MTSAERVAVVGTGLIGTSIAMASVRAGETVRGFDTDADALARAAERSGLTPSAPLEESVVGATLVFVCTPVPELPGLVSEILRLAPDAIVTDVGSVKTRVMSGVEATADPAHLDRYIGGHPMGGSGRSGCSRRLRRCRRPRWLAWRPGWRRSARARCRWTRNVTTVWWRW